MRGAKFRVVDSFYGYVGYESVIEGVWQFSSDGVEWESGTFESSEPEQLKRYEYTGLKDKNGVEIYEGDICRIDWGHWNDCTEETCAEHGFDIEEIVFEDGGFWPCCGAGQEGAPAIDMYEVIGNINENPELLEVK